MKMGRKRKMKEIEVKPVVKKSKIEGGQFVLHLIEIGSSNRSLAVYIKEDDAKRLLIAGNGLTKKEVAGPHLYNLYNCLIKAIAKDNRQVDKFVIDAIFDKKYYGNIYQSVYDNSSSYENEPDLLLLREGVILCVILEKPIFVTANMFKATTARTNEILLENTPRKDMGKMQ